MLEDLSSFICATLPGMGKKNQRQFVSKPRQHRQLVSLVKHALPLGHNHIFCTVVQLQIVNIISGAGLTTPLIFLFQNFDTYGNVLFQGQKEDLN